MKPIHPVVKEIGEKCAWCLKNLSEPYMLCAKLPVCHSMKADTVLLPIDLRKADRVVHAIVMQPGSEGKKEGYDIMFGLCSENCATSLKKAIEEDAAGFQFCN